jgi:hypothetical protein
MDARACPRSWNQLVGARAGLAVTLAEAMPINIYGHLLPSVEAALSEGLTATFNAGGEPKVAEIRP